MGRGTVTRRATTGALAVALALAGAACSDDDDGGSDATNGEGAAGSVEAYCDDFFGVEVGFTEEADPAAIGALLDDIEASHPAEAESWLSVMVPAARATLEGDDSLVEAPEFAEAVNQAGAYNSEHCDAGTASIRTIDYGFRGIPTELPAGRHIVQLTNEGNELHEMVLLRKNDGVTQSFSEIFGLGEEQAQQLVTTAGFAFVGVPGSSTYLYAELEPGEYAAACFLPVGATDFATLETLGEDAPPHFVQGMVAELTVTG